MSCRHKQITSNKENPLCSLLNADTIRVHPHKQYHYLHDRRIHNIINLENSHFFIRLISKIT